jgi:hypothetical protein
MTGSVAKKSCDVHFSDSINDEHIPTHLPARGSPLQEPVDDSTRIGIIRVFRRAGALTDYVSRCLSRERLARAFSRGPAREAPCERDRSERRAAPALGWSSSPYRVWDRSIQSPTKGPGGLTGCTDTEALGVRSPEGSCVATASAELDHGPAW